MKETQESRLLFYQIMKYPIPTYKEYFFHTDKKTEHKDKIWSPSRTESSSLVEDYCNYINKRSKFFKHIPFIETIYLCNSITFNTIHEDSDIDIFIVTKKKCLRRARFASVFFFRILGLKRSITNKKKKFCLSFYVTEDKQNLYNISLPNTDIYLAYWIAHLVPLYEAKPNNAKIYKHNTRIQSILANIETEQAIFLNITKTEGESKVKKIIEWIHNGLRWKITEKMIKTIWLPIVIYKTQKLKGKGEDIIVNDHMLKFYADQRKRISLLYKLTKDKLETGR